MAATETQLMLSVGLIGEFLGLLFSFVWKRHSGQSHDSGTESQESDQTADIEELIQGAVLGASLHRL